MTRSWQSHLLTGDRMRLAMKRSRLTLPDMVERTGASPDLVADWLAGRAAPGAEVLRAWSKATGASLAWLSEAPAEETPTRRYVRGSRTRRQDG